MTARKKKSTKKKKKRRTSADLSTGQQQNMLHRHPSTGILSKAQNQWQFGDWQSLSELNKDELESAPNRAYCALYAAAGHLQCGNVEDARALLQKSKQWGAPEEDLRRVLISGVYNSLSRARLINGQETTATALMHTACEVGMPGGDERLLLAARLAFQAAQLDLPQPRIRSAMEALPRTARERLAKGQQRLAKQSSADGLSARLHSILDTFADNVLRQGREMVLDGVRAFDTKDPFRPGKLALAFSYRVTACESSGPELADVCRQFEQVVELTREDLQETWGIYFYLLALVRLKKHGVLEKCVAAYRLEELRKKLDWRGFIDEDNYQLKGKPNNFYGVAFGIAEHRATLGWDDPVHGEILLQRMLHHYRKHSHPYGFADETEGQGRYDRYSVLLIAEIAQRLRETGRPLTSEMQTWLRNSAQFVLVNLNQNGDGFQFGRSIGAYGDTAFLEILSASAWHGVLTQVEARMAYAFCRRATRKFLGFWYDEARQSVNLWEDGRATDGYRGKHRILGENLSLLHQHIYTDRIWEQLGFKPSAQLDEEFSRWLEQLPRYTLTRFSNDHGPKAALTVRDGSRVFSLWLVNPANYHANGAYAPAPFSPGLVQAIPDQAIHALTPVLELEDGTQFLPLAYFDDIHLEEHEGQAILSCAQTGLATVKNGKLSRDDRVSVQSRFIFSPGTIQREDKFTLAEDSSIAGIQLRFPVLQPARVEDHTATLGEQEEIIFHVTGFDELSLEDSADFDTGGTPQGRIQACLHARKTISQQPLTETTVSWTLNYQ